MIRVCKNDKESVFAMIRQGKLDAAALSTSNLVDEIILSMYKHGIFTCLENGICDKRAANTTVPFGIIWAAAIAAKMKVQTSLSDIPFALSDHRTLAELGYTLYDPDGVYSGLMREGSLRFLLGKYNGMNCSTHIGLQSVTRLFHSWEYSRIFIYSIVHRLK